MNLAIIPARGGSKRIPRKNIKIFCGKPIIEWSIAAAIRSKCFDKIIVSTDDEEIAQIAIKLGAEVPFFRPSNLSDDYAGTLPVIAHAIEWENSHGSMVKNACCIYPAAPFIQVDDLKLGYEILVSKNLDYAFTAAKYIYPVQRGFRLNANERIEMLFPEHIATRTQDLIEVLHDAGQFYWGTASAWLEHRNIFGLNAGPIVLPSYRVQDIDTLEDWVRAELLFKCLS